MMDRDAAKGKRRRNSRYGCRNCKLRKLKCDETRPHCARCRTYGVLCNFSLSVPDLQPLPEKQRQQGTRSGFVSLQPPVGKAIWAEDGSSYFVLDTQDQELFRRFRYRTLHSLGGPAMVDIFENYMLRASFTCPFLMHGTLAVTAVHDRYLGITPPRMLSLRGSYHWSRCTTLFNKWLSQPLTEEYKDALWATAGILAVMAFSSSHATCLKEAWPLRQSDSSDLEWVRLGAGKMALRDLVDPLRQESVFRTMSESFHMHQPLPTKGTEGIPESLAQVCRLGEESTQANNPYFAVAHRLSRLPEAATSDAAKGQVMMVSGQMHHEFGASLEKKDPVALLLLCLWYAKARGSRWWIDVRVNFEFPAICTYLQRHYGENSAIQALVPWDKIELP